MRHDVDVPDPLPAAVGDFFAAVEPNAGVRTVQDDGADVQFCVFDQVLDLRFLADVGADGEGSGVLCNSGEPSAVDVGDDDTAGSFMSEAVSEGATDAAGGSVTTTILSLMVMAAGQYTIL